VDATGAEVRFANGSTERFRSVIFATGFRVDDSWIDAPTTDGVVPVGPHRRGPVSGLWVVRANLLASLHFGALEAAADIARSGG